MNDEESMKNPARAVGVRRVAVVTGASAGIGAATARRLADDGYAVVITARRADRLEELADEIRAGGGEVLVVPGDIARLDVCRQVIADAARWGRIEVLVANAGIGYSGDFDKMSDEAIRTLVNVNLLGVMRTVKEAIPAMRINGHGVIVIVGSILSRIVSTRNAVYCATKHAVAGFADTIRPEVRADGIRVVSILPGYTDTEFFDAMLSRQPRPMEQLPIFAAFRRHVFAPAAAVAEEISRRIESPRAEVVIGAVNTAVVFFGTRFPGAFRLLLEVMERASRRSVVDEATPAPAVE